MGFLRKQQPDDTPTAASTEEHFLPTALQPLSSVGQTAGSPLPRGTGRGWRHMRNPPSPPRAHGPWGDSQLQVAVASTKGRVQGEEQEGACRSAASTVPAPLLPLPANRHLGNIHWVPDMTHNQCFARDNSGCLHPAPCCQGQEPQKRRGESRRSEKATSERKSSP